MARKRDLFRRTTAAPRRAPYGSLVVRCYPISAQIALHSANNLTKQTALSEKGDIVNGRGDTPNKHDALTGTMPDGKAFPAGDDKTCHNWTSSTQGTAIVGHIDRQGLRDDDASRSWNSSHPSRGPDGGCSQADLRSTGGDGLFYCFAVN